MAPLKNGNTAYRLNTLAEKFQHSNVEVEQIQFGGQNIRDCTACMACRKNRNERCIINTDIVNDCIQKIKSADAIIMGSPAYYAMVTAETKALIERAGYMAT
ncbi:flavodoxin family protein, partial [bacterium]|nr:flavodoxin family protein [bacterium]